jgi:hypothetical protein
MLKANQVAKIYFFCINRPQIALIMSLSIDNSKEASLLSAHQLKSMPNEMKCGDGKASLLATHVI